MELKVLGLLQDDLAPQPGDSRRNPRSLPKPNWVVFAPEPTRAQAAERHQEDVCSDCLILFSTDEGDVCQEQRFMPDRRRPAERHGGARRPVLAGHSAAPPAHREGNQKTPWTLNCAMISLHYITEWTSHISMFWSALMTPWFVGQLLTFLAFKAQFFFSGLLQIIKKKLPTHWSLETWLISPHFSCKRPRKQTLQQLYYCYIYIITSFFVTWSSSSRNSHAGFISTTNIQSRFNPL